MRSTICYEHCLSFLTSRLFALLREWTIISSPKFAANLAASAGHHYIIKLSSVQFHSFIQTLAAIFPKNHIKCLF